MKKFVIIAMSLLALTAFIGECDDPARAESKAASKPPEVYSDGLGDAPKYVDPKVDAHEVDYLREVDVRRWPQSKMPLKVYIAINGERSFDSKLCTLVAKAFSQWLTTQASLEAVRIYEWQKADIVVERAAFGELPDNTGGHTYYDFDMNSRELKKPIVRARVLVYSPSSHASDLDAEATDTFYNICVHEAGHAFGLDGHSSDSDDVLFVKSTTSKLSRRDLCSIIHMYSK